MSKPNPLYQLRLNSYCALLGFLVTSDAKANKVVKLISGVMVVIKQIRWPNVMHFQVSCALRRLVAVLTGSIVALDCQAALSAPVAAVIGMATCATAKCGIVLAADMLRSTIKGTVKVLVFLGFRRRNAELLLAGFARYQYGGTCVLEFRGATQAAKDVFALLSGCLHVEVLPAMFAYQFFGSMVSSHGTGMLPTAKNIIFAKALNSPTFDPDRLLAVSARRIQFVARTLHVMFSGMAFCVPMGRMLDYPAATAIA